VSGQDYEPDGAPGSASGKAPEPEHSERTREERIKRAKEHADQKRVEAGLPPEPEDDLYSDASMAKRKRTRRVRKK
jgi:hypothetical protein